MRHLRKRPQIGGEDGSEMDRSMSQMIDISLVSSSQVSTKFQGIFAVVPSAFYPLFSKAYAKRVV